MADGRHTGWIAGAPCFFLGALAALILGWFLLLASRRNTRSRLPPGPPGIPILGHLHILEQGSKRFKQFQDWHDKYGPLVSLKLGSSNFFLLGGDGTLVRELLDKRGAVYSQRPEKRFAMIMDDYESPIFERDTAKWRINRKLFVQNFTSIHSTHTRQEHVPVIEAESNQLLYDLLHSPELFMEHSIRFASSVMTSLVYGVRGSHHDSYTVTGIEKIMTVGGDLNAMVPALDEFPFLMYLPEFVWPWRKPMSVITKLRASLYKDLADKAQIRVDSGLNPEAFAKRVYTAKNELQLTDRRVHMILAVAHEINIVANVITACLMALVNYPRVLQKAQEEVDSVCDEDTVPKWSDWDRLPYVRMVVKEALRWRPPFPWGVMHAVDEDDIWNGYTIPKGSTVLMNIWNIHMNPDRYPNPEEFWPERFESFPLSSSEYINSSDSLLRDHYTFGAGRRSCPGLVIADIDLFLSISKILWAFDLSTPDGQPLDTSPDTAFTGPNLRRPLPFKMTFRVRSEAKARTIETEMRAAEENVFSRFGS